MVPGGDPDERHPENGSKKPWPDTGWSERSYTPRSGRWFHQRVALLIVTVGIGAAAVAGVGVISTLTKDNGGVPASTGPITPNPFILPKPPSPASERRIYLAYFPTSFYGAVNNGPIIINKRKYLHGISLTAYPFVTTLVQYRLGWRCDQLTYTAGVVDNSSKDAVIRFEVYGDDRILKQFQLAYGQDSQQAVSVKNVVTLKLQTIGLQGSDRSLTAGWGDAAVYCSSGTY